MKEKILVTGGTGYIGSHTTVEPQNAGYDVVIIDNSLNSNETVLDGIEKISGVRPAFVKGDCTDIETLRMLFRQHHGIKGIINFAASKAVGESVQKPLLYYRNNLNTLINLLELMPEFDVKGNRVLFIMHSLRRAGHEPYRRNGSLSSPQHLPMATQSRFLRK